MVTRTACEVAVRSQPNPFSWAEIEHEPKVQRCCIGRSFRSTEYEILHTGGFVRLCTERGRVYWLAQNENDHRLPDWKIHFSVHLADIPRAWNILTDLFLKEACDFGMKAVAGEAFDSWPPEQRGREITETSTTSGLAPSLSDKLTFGQSLLKKRRGSYQLPTFKVVVWQRVT